MPFCWLGCTDILTLLIITGHLCVLRKGIMCFYIKHCYEGSLSREAAVITKIKQLQTCLAKCFFNEFSRVCFTAPTWFCGVMYQSCWRVARINSFMQRWEPRAARSAGLCWGWAGNACFTGNVLAGHEISANLRKESPRYRWLNGCYKWPFTHR